MIDQSGVFILDLMTTEVKRRAGTGGGEYKGPCPKCGGVDRFFVQPHKTPHGRARCRQCKDEWMDPIAFVQWRDGVDFMTARRMLGLDGIEAPISRAVARMRRDRSKTASPPPKAVTEPPSAPDADWQADMELLIARAEQLLAENPPPLLKERGIDMATAKRFRLGVFPKEVKDWKGHYIPVGLCIPHCRNGECVAVRVRIGAGEYRHVKGGGGKQLYGLTERFEDPTVGLIDEINHALVFLVESELDALTLIARGYYAVATGGASGGRADAKALMRRAAKVMCAFDADDAGDAAAEWWELQGAKRVHPRGGKDIGDMYAAGVLAEWLAGCI